MSPESSSPAGPEVRWPTGEQDVESMVQRGELETVEPSAAHAELLLQQAESHLESARKIADADPPSAFTLLYDGARKAMTAVLAQQGLRPTRDGGHVAVGRALEAQLGANARLVTRPFRGLRLRRHETEYPRLGDVPVTRDEVGDALGDARSIVEAMRKMIRLVGPWD